MDQAKKIVRTLQRKRWKNMSDKDLAKAFVHLMQLAHSMGISVMLSLPVKK